VSKEGKIAEITIRKANNEYVRSCSESVVRAIKGWVPAVSNNKHVDFQIILPITF
jgi:hypothetical protein